MYATIRSHSPTPTGLDIAVDGARERDYYAQLQQDVSFTIAKEKDKVVIINEIGEGMSKDELKQLGKTLKGKDKELFNAITDSKHHVTIHAIDGTKDSGVYLGASHGSVHTIAFGQTSLLDQPQNKGGMTSSQVVGHETLEGYYESNGDSQVDAHVKTNKFFPGFNSPPVWDQYRLQGGNMVIGLIGNQTTANGINERTTTEFDTPVPLADFKKGKGAPYSGYPIDVKKVP